MPGAFVFVRGAETYERIFDRDLGQRLAGHNYEKMLSRRIAIELKPPQPFISFNRRRNIDWNMRGDPVVATFQSRVRKDHFRRTVAFGVELPMTLFVTPSPVDFWLGPLFGPAFEYHVDRELTLGLNTRFGPIIETAGGTTHFGFVTQLLIAYRL